MKSFGRLFRDREDAGRQLAEKLKAYRLPSDTVVLGLPRGGVAVAYQVADRLNFQLDVVVVRKLGVPGQEELAMGAIAGGGITLLNNDMVRTLGLSQEQVNDVIDVERQELSRRELLYRGGRPEINVKGRTLVVVDDGLATGSTMSAAVLALRQKEPGQLVVAVPVASEETCAKFKADVDDAVCLVTPEEFYAVGQWYQSFSQTTDDEVKELLAKAHQRTASMR